MPTLETRLNDPEMGMTMGQSDTSLCFNRKQVWLTYSDLLRDLAPSGRTRSVRNPPV